MVIDQYDPLRRFDCSNYRVIVENVKELLNVLYKKVQASKEMDFDLERSSVASEVKEINKCNIGEEVEFVEKKPLITV